MGTGDYGVKVEEGRDDNVQLVGVEGNPVVAEEPEGGGGSKSDGGDEPTRLHVTEWMRKRLGSSLAAKALEAVAQQSRDPLPVAPGGWRCTGWDPVDAGDRAGARPHCTPPQ